MAEYVLDHANPVYWCAWSRSSNVILTGSSSTIKAWDSQTGLWLSTGVHPAGRIPYWRAVHNQWLTSFRDDTIVIFDPFTWTRILTLYNVSNVVSCSALSPDRLRLAIEVGHNIIKIWSVRTGTFVRTLPQGHDVIIRNCVFSLDGSLLAVTSTDGVTKVWSTGDGCAILNHGGQFVPSIFSPCDNTLLATTSYDKAIKLWNARTGVCLGTLTGHTVRVTKCVFSPDGVYLAAPSMDMTIRIWEVYTGACVHLMQHECPVTWCDFSPDGSMMVGSSAQTNTACIWRLPSRLQHSVKLLLAILVGYRHCSWWLPPEMWDMINSQWFFYI